MRRWTRSVFARPAFAGRRVAVVLAVLLVAGAWQSAKGEFCFAAGTPLLTPNGGAKPIEQFVAGDLILSRDQWDVEGPVEPKVVEEVFVRFGGVLCLSAGGQTIKTTHAHPFWVVGKGWLPAKDIQVGDWLLGHDGQRTQVDAHATGEGTVQPNQLYNFRDAEFNNAELGLRRFTEHVGIDVNQVLKGTEAFQPTVGTKVADLKAQVENNQAKVNETLGTLENAAKFNTPMDIFVYIETGGGSIIGALFRQLPPRPAGFESTLPTGELNCDRRSSWYANENI